MLIELKRKIADGFLIAADVAGLVLSASGASVVALLGKFMLAVVLGAAALGFFLRLVGRRRPVPVAPARTPTWCSIASAGLAVIEVALLAEATNLPVRFYQPGFEPQHWGLVLIALVVAYVVHMQIFRSITSRRRVESQP